MHGFRFSTLFILVATVTIFSACNTQDTGISKPVPDCFDGIQNQGELGVDCGGPCLETCPSKMTAKVDGAAWESAGNITSFETGNQLRIIGSNSSSTISITHQGAFETGTYNLYQALYQNYTSGLNYFSNQGTVSFTSWNESDRIVSGTFNFTSWESTGTGDTIIVTQGTFDSVHY